MKATTQVTKPATMTTWRRSPFYDDSGNFNYFKLNKEACEGMKHIGETAHKNKNFKMADIDLSQFGMITSQVNVHLDPQVLIEHNCKSLAALINATSSAVSSSATSSGYSSVRSVDSNISASSLPPFQSQR